MLLGESGEDELFAGDGDLGRSKKGICSQRKNSNRKMDRTSHPS